MNVVTSVYISDGSGQCYIDAVASDGSGPGGAEAATDGHPPDHNQLCRAARVPG